MLKKLRINMVYDNCAFSSADGTFYLAIDYLESPQALEHVVWGGKKRKKKKKTMMASANFSSLILFFSFHFTLKNPMIKSSKMKSEIVLKDENPRSDIIQIVMEQSREQVWIAWLSIMQLDQSCKDIWCLMYIRMKGKDDAIPHV